MQVKLEIDSELELELELEVNKYLPSLNINRLSQRVILYCTSLVVRI